MEFSPLHFFQLTLPFLLILFLLLGFLILLVQIGILEYAYEKMGIHRRYVFALLFLSLLGSYVNIPVAELPGEKITSRQEIFFFGMRYVIPVIHEWPRTVVAVNLGGAVAPTLVSLYLMVKNKLYVLGLMSVVIVASIVHWLAQPVTGLGIAVPIFIQQTSRARRAHRLHRRGRHFRRDLLGRDHCSFACLMKFISAAPKARPNQTSIPPLQYAITPGSPTHFCLTMANPSSGTWRK